MKKLLRFNYLAYSTLLFVLGIIILIFNVRLYKSIVLFLLFFISIDTIKNIFIWIIKKKKNITDLIINFLTIILIIFMFTHKVVPYAIFPIITGLYICLNGIIKSISTYNLFITNSSGKIFYLFISITFFIIGFSLILSPITHLHFILLLIGIYTILLSLNYLKDYLNDLNKREIKKLRRKIRITLPVFIDAFIPYSTIKIHEDKFNENELVFTKTNEKPDLEILIHVSLNGNGKFGHVDFLYKNIVYSYGNYDNTTYKLFDSLGDGVLFKTEKNKYIKFCIEDKEKTIFVYGIKLNDDQKKALEKTLAKIEDNLYPWNPQNNAKYYASRLNKNAKTKFYKFKKGKFKKFFLLNNNCAYFTDKIIGETGTDILKISGIITPGAYYEYLNIELKKKNSMVISRNIYNNTNYKNLS